jgi:hypothetical protein
VELLEAWRVELLEAPRGELLEAWRVALLGARPAKLLAAERPVESAEVVTSGRRLAVAAHRLRRFPPCWPSPSWCCSVGVAQGGPWLNDSSQMHHGEIGAAPMGRLRADPGRGVRICCSGPQMCVR